MRLNKGFLIFLVLILFISLTVSGAENRIEDMNFKQAEINDVLRAVAEVAEVNLITDQSVSGQITVHLRDITFRKALDLITQSHGLDYKWDENTVVVATPERIDSIYSRVVTEMYELDVPDREQVRDILNNLYTELNIQLDSNRKQLILQGKEEQVSRALELVKKLEAQPALIEEKAVKTEEEKEKEEDEEREPLYSKKVEIDHANLEEIGEKLRNVNPGLEVKINSLDDSITIKGEKNRVRAAVEMAAEYDRKQQVDSRFIRVDYVELDRVEEILNELYPEIGVQQNENNRELIIRGVRSQLKEAIATIKKINQPRQQVIIEARVEEVSSQRAEELGINTEDNLSTIKLGKDEDGQINSLDMTWPEVLKAMEEEGYAENLANPRLMTLNGEQAEMLIGDQVPVKMENDEGETSIQYIDAGVTLRFTPWITDDGQIELEVNPEVSDLSREYGDLPSKQTREVTTNLRLQDGQTFVIGGLIQGDSSNNYYEVPVLSEIPLLGHLFKRKDKSSSRTELLIFITPKILTEGLEEIKGDSHLISGDLEVNIDSEVKPQPETATTETDTDKDSSASSTTTPEESQDEREEPRPADNQEQGEEDFNSLSPEELQNILNQSRKQRVSRTLEGLPKTFYLMYKIKEGETIEEVAADYGLAPSTVKSYNGLDTGVKAGRLITLPLPRTQLYRVQSGEDLQQIADRFGFKVQELRQLNQLSAEDEIAAEEIIVFPEAVKEVEENQQ